MNPRNCPVAIIIRNISFGFGLSGLGLYRRRADFPIKRNPNAIINKAKRFGKLIKISFRIIGINVNPNPIHISNAPSLRVTLLNSTPRPQIPKISSIAVSLRFHYQKYPKKNIKHNPQGY